MNSVDCSAAILDFLKAKVFHVSAEIHQKCGHVQLPLVELVINCIWKRKSEYFCKFSDNLHFGVGSAWFISLLDEFLHWRLNVEKTTFVFFSLT